MITDPPAGHAVTGLTTRKPAGAQPGSGEMPKDHPGRAGKDRWAALDVNPHEMAALEEDFPDFRIWREITGERVRFVARSLDSGTRPHTLITADLAELRAGLAIGQHTASTQAAPGQPNIARMYSYMLGGKDHLATDRRAAGEILEAFPEVLLLARANRHFVTRAVRHAASAGVSQFIDVGAGLPESPNVHEAAQQVNPGARVAYVDSDPVVVAHGRALMAGGPGVTVVAGDMREPAAILASPALRRVIDPAEPVCVLLASVLHFVTPAQADAVVAAFVTAMAPGSFLVLSAGTSTGTDPDLLVRLERAYAGTAAVSGRTAAEIAGYFADLELEPPGLVDVWAWRPEHEWYWPAPPSARLIGAVGRKPARQAGAPDRALPHPPASAA